MIFYKLFKNIVIIMDNIYTIRLKKNIIILIDKLHQKNNYYIV